MIRKNLLSFSSFFILLPLSMCGTNIDRELASINNCMNHTAPYISLSKTEGRIALEKKLDSEKSAINSWIIEQDTLEKDMKISWWEKFKARSYMNRIFLGAASAAGIVGSVWYTSQYNQQFLSPLTAKILQCAGALTSIYMLWSGWNGRYQFAKKILKRANTWSDENSIIFLNKEAKEDID